MNQAANKKNAGKRRRLILGLAGLVALCVLAAAAWMAGRPVRPSDQASDPEPAATQAETEAPVNVVVFLIDTLRADRIGAYGHPQPTTPNIDSLANEGVTFEHCTAGAPWTCPSVVSLLTSTYACQHRVLHDRHRLSTAIRTLPEKLRDVGYKTVCFWANAYAAHMTGLDRAYDLCRNVPGTNGSVVDAWLRSGPQTPFFLYIHNIEPHNPYAVPARFVEPFGTVQPGQMQQVQAAYLHYRRLTRADFAAGLPLGTTDNTQEQARAMDRMDNLKSVIDILYDASVRLADERVGSVVQVLKRRGLWDNTLFIVTSDHGEELGDHGGWQHDQSAYEELMHVPLIVKLPNGLYAGRRVDAQVSLLDVMPTVLQAVGHGDLATGCQGTSLLPLPSAGQAGFRVPGLRINRKKYYRPYKEQRGNVNVIVRQGRFKGIWNAEPETLELYDLDLDPGEHRNLAAERTDLAIPMQRYARQWLEACGAGAAPAVEGGEVDEKTLENLRSLGYVD